MNTQLTNFKKFLSAIKSAWHLHMRDAKKTNEVTQKNEEVNAEINAEINQEIKAKTAAEIIEILPPTLLATEKKVGAAQKIAEITEINSVSPPDSRLQQMAEGDAFLARLQIPEACALFFALLKKEPNDIELMHRLFSAASQQPESEAFHFAAAQIFALPAKHGDFIFEVFTLYLKLAKPFVRFSAKQIAHLSAVFEATNHPLEATQLTRLLASEDQREEHFRPALNLV